MSFFIEDGEGSGRKAGVTREGRLKAESITHELQHHYSMDEGQVYQIVGRESTVAAATQTVLHIRNTSTTRAFVVSYMRLQLIGTSGGTALPAEASYFQIGFGRTYSADGSAVTAVNMNRTSGNTADLVAYDEAPTLAGTFVEADAWYPDGEGMMTFNKHGSLILGYNDTMEIRLITDVTDGTAYARVTGMFITNGS